MKMPEKNIWLNNLVDGLAESYAQNPELMETDTAYLPDRKSHRPDLGLARSAVPGFTNESVNLHSAPYSSAVD